MSATADATNIHLEKVSTPAAVATVARLAHEIWYEHYVPIIGRAQVDYMVPRFQSETAIARQVELGMEYHLLHCSGQPVGYFAFAVQPVFAGMFLSKLYVLKARRGGGVARAALDYMESECRNRTIRLLWLTVNRANPAIAVYGRLGFCMAGPVTTDIGGGYVMDDFRMEKNL